MRLSSVQTLPSLHGEGLIFQLENISRRQKYVIQNIELVMMC